MRIWDTFINDTERMCRKCLVWKPFSSFHKHKQCLNGYNTVCKECRKPISKANYARSTKESRLLSGAKYRAEINGREFNLKEDDILIPESCPILHTRFTEKGDYSPSLDRVDNSKGYVKDNIRVISKRANTLKGTATVEELKSILLYMETHL